MKREKLVYLNEIETNYDQKIRIIKNDHDLSLIDDDEAIDFVKKLNCSYITLFDKTYPKILKLLPKPPLVIYYIGELTLFNKNIVGIIGVVSPTTYSKTATIDVASNLDENSVLISNYSYGNSHVALIYGVKSKRKIIATLSNGFSYLSLDKHVLLKEVANNGLIISIIPYFTKSTRENYNKTIEMIIMLSHAILIMQGKKNSSQIKAANYAIDYDKDVYVLPGLIYDEEFMGNNELIQDGANILYKGIKI